MNKKRLTKAQQALIKKLRGGQTLCHQKGDPEFFIDGVGAVNARTVAVLLRSELIAPAKDSLFGDDSQVFILT